jgi:hypothetical protein
MGSTNWFGLLLVIETRENLESVMILDADEPDERNPHERVTPFLLAIQQNATIQTVQLLKLHLSGNSMASFIYTATSVTALAIAGSYGMGDPGGARAIAAALQRSTNLQQLKLHSLHETDLIPIVNSLASKESTSSIKSLSIMCYNVGEEGGVEFHAAISSLLQPHSLLHSLNLYHPINDESYYGLEESHDVNRLFSRDKPSETLLDW